MSYFNLFIKDYESYLMNASACFEICSSKLKLYKLVESTRESILNETKLLNNDIEDTKHDNKVKFESIILARLYEKGIAYLQRLSNNSKKGEVYYGANTQTVLNRPSQRFIQTLHG